MILLILLGVVHISSSSFVVTAVSAEDLDSVVSVSPFVFSFVATVVSI